MHSIFPSGFWAQCSQGQAEAGTLYLQGSRSIRFIKESAGRSSPLPSPSGISLFPIILDAHFFTPVHREVCLLAGFRGNSRQGLTNILTNG